LNPKDRCGIFVNLLPPVQNARKKRSIGNIGDEDVAFVYVRQANAGQNCHPPVQSGALFDVIEENGKHHTIHVEAN
jgi:predicted glutamine amidotransferase